MLRPMVPSDFDAVLDLKIERAPGLLRIRHLVTTDPAGARVTTDGDGRVDVALDAGLRLQPSGAVRVRGALGPTRPYIPSGSYL